MRIVAIVIALLVSGCTPEPENPLIGTWAADGERTLAELRTLDDPPKVAVVCFETGICGNSEVQYLKHTYVTTSRAADGRLLGEATAPYEVIETTERYVVIDQFENGGTFQVYFQDESAIYIETEQGFNDYYIRR